MLFGRFRGRFGGCVLSALGEFFRRVYQQQTSNGSFRALPKSYTDELLGTKAIIFCKVLGWFWNGFVRF